MTDSPRGGQPKRIRTEAEIAKAAERLGADWVEGDHVQTWIYRHEGKAGELSEMIEDGWSWADLSRAMFAAGICYRTGRPIPPTTLSANAYRARLKYRRKLEGAALMRAGLTPREAAPAVPSKADVASPSLADDDDDRLNFEIKPVTLRNWSGPKPEATSPTEDPPPLKSRSKEPIDVDARIAAFLGKKLPPEEG